jgi:hypothetical protein
MSKESLNCKWPKQRIYSLGFLVTLAGLRAARKHNSDIAGLVAATAVVMDTLKPAGKRGTP